MRLIAAGTDIPFVCLSLLALIYFTGNATASRVALQLPSCQCCCWLGKINFSLYYWRGHDVRLNGALAPGTPSASVPWPAQLHVSLHLRSSSLHPSVLPGSLPCPAPSQHSPCCGAPSSPRAFCQHCWGKPALLTSCLLLKAFLFCLPIFSQVFAPSITEHH